jgi:hypothetical protein
VGCFACGRGVGGIVDCPLGKHCWCWWRKWGVLDSEAPATGTADRRQRAQARSGMMSCPKSKMELLLRRWWWMRMMALRRCSQDHDSEDSDQDLIMKTGRRSRGGAV